MKTVFLTLALSAWLVPGGLVTQKMVQGTGAGKPVLRKVHGRDARATFLVQGTGVVEPVLGLQVGPEGITFQVYSGGCTEREHFRVERFGSDPVQLLLIRMTPDTCEAYIPYGTTVRYSYESLGLENDRRFIVLNPMSPVRVVKPAQP
jgi:hypothetical protein